MWYVRTAKDYVLSKQTKLAQNYIVSNINRELCKDVFLSVFNGIVVERSSVIYSFSKPSEIKKRYLKTLRILGILKYRFKCCFLLILFAFWFTF